MLEILGLLVVLWFGSGLSVCLVILGLGLYDDYRAGLMRTINWKNVVKDSIILTSLGFITVIGFFMMMFDSWRDRKVRG